jgi:hypothetical protein
LRKGVIHDSPGKERSDSNICARVCPVLPLSCCVKAHEGLDRVGKEMGLGMVVIGMGMLGLGERNRHLYLLHPSVHVEAASQLEDWDLLLLLSRKNGLQIIV